MHRIFLEDSAGACNSECLPGEKLNGWVSVEKETYFSLYIICTFKFDTV